MKNVKSIRKIDSLGRIVIPVDLRRALEIDEMDDLCISLSGSRIVIQKEVPECTFCGSTTNLIPQKNKFICEKCRKDVMKK